jgi:hypothetical protein
MLWKVRFFTNLGNPAPPLQTHRRRDPKRQPFDDRRAIRVVVTDSGHEGSCPSYKEQNVIPLANRGYNNRLACGEYPEYPLIVGSQDKPGCVSRNASIPYLMAD